MWKCWCCKPVHAVVPNPNPNPRQCTKGWKGANCQYKNCVWLKTGMPGYTYDIIVPRKRYIFYRIRVTIRRGRRIRRVWITKRKLNPHGGLRPATSWRACSNICRSVGRKCISWVYTKSINACYLKKRGLKVKGTFPGRVSGVRACGL